MLTLQQWRPKSKLEVPETPLTRAKFPVIDAHNHLRSVTDAAELVDKMDAFNIATIVDLDGTYHGGFDAQMKKLVEPYPDRFRVLCQVDMDQIDDPDFGRNMARHIEECVKRGAAGVKFHKTMVGLKARDKDGHYVKPDDERLRPIFEQAAKLDVPVLIHVADPVAFFEPTDENNERYEELFEHPTWTYYNVGTPGFYELLEAQERMLEQNRETTFVVAHIGSYAENLAAVSKMLDRHPNMYVDTAERIAELGRQPYSSRDFIMKYADRVLYGTDLVPNAHNTSYNYRFFETKDEYFPYNTLEEHNQGRWMIYGIYLPDDVLHKVYVDNAKKLFFKNR
nr:amidohydrolase family protein [bacterium]